jgi:hypothetical protein
MAQHYHHVPRDDGIAFPRRRLILGAESRKTNEIEKREETVQAKTIKVTWTKKNGVQVSDKKAQLNWDTPDKPDSVEWVFKGTLPDGVEMRIMWDVRAPFDKVARVPGTSAILGTWNTMEQGIFEYSVVMVELATGQILAGIDPMIINDPPPF